MLTFAYLFIPVVYTFVFSFNDPGQFNYAWQDFSLETWQNPCGVARTCAARWRPACRSPSWRR